jgi:DMSO/TMAO reductase YedYZ molybdopterin-dependent catalytic subunit
MSNSFDRRQLIQGGAALGALAALESAFRLEAQAAGEEVIPFADVKPFNPEKPNIRWDQLTRITPDEQIFSVGHYGTPEVDASSWKLDVSGLVRNKRAFTLAELKSRSRKEHTVTLECSGNGPAGGLIGTTKWAGTPLAGVLKDCGLAKEGIEIVFFAADSGTEKIRGGEYKQNFARSMPAEDAMKDNVLLCYEMNGAPLVKGHGAPLRVVAPGWYGISWVKWLTRIEVHDRPYLGRFNGRDYVTIRGEERNGETIWRETSVGRMNLKSVPARAVRQANGDVRITGAAWGDGTPIKAVEVRIDDGPWTGAKMEAAGDRYVWRLWSYEWKSPAKGEHTVTSRAVDVNGKVQPGPDDAWIKLKKTYWEANQQTVRKLVV